MSRKAQSPLGERARIFPGVNHMIKRTRSVTSVTYITRHASFLTTSTTTPSFFAISGSHYGRQIQAREKEQARQASRTQTRSRGRWKRLEGKLPTREASLNLMHIIV